MRRRQIRRALTLGLGFVVAVVAGSGLPASTAHAQTASNTLTGEGGSFLSPVTNLLLESDTGLSPLYPAYGDSNLDDGIADFTGTAPGQFDADFVVTERPLTSAEAANAQANGRSYAYVPFAATPVAIAVFAICNESNFNNDVVNPTPFCPDLPLTPEQIGQIFTTGNINSSESGASSLPTPLTSWSEFNQFDASDSACDQITGSSQVANAGSPVPDTEAITLASTLAPSAENSTLMALMDSNTTAKALLDNALNNPGANTSSTTSDTPSEIWPFQGPHAYIGGDEGLVEKELNIEPSTDAPDYLDTWAALNPGTGSGHDAFPVSAVWTGSPEGTPWDVPTAAVENADGCFVGPTLAAAQAAESGSGITFDPTTNLVTFNAQSTSTTAYNNYLMAESYLVVPTNGLPAEKATKLAQFIRYILGATGQSEIETLGAAPATAAEVTAGLQVASELDAEAITTSSSGTGGTGTTSGAPGASGSSTDASDTSSGDGGSLAFTGGNPLPIVAMGLLLAGLATFGRRRLVSRAKSRVRRPRARPAEGAIR